MVPWKQRHYWVSKPSLYKHGPCHLNALVVAASPIAISAAPVSSRMADDDQEETSTWSLRLGMYIFAIVEFFLLEVIKFRKKYILDKKKKLVVGSIQKHDKLHRFTLLPHTTFTESYNSPDGNAYWIAPCRNTGYTLPLFGHQTRDTFHLIPAHPWIHSKCLI